MLLLFAMVKRMPRRRSKSDTGLPQYPLSATMRLGRRRGRPRLGRWTAPLEISVSTALASWLWPGVKTSVINLPWRSVRRWTLVLNPPWLRPSASASAVVFLPLPRADAHAQWCRRGSGLPNRCDCPHPLRFVTVPKSDPRCLLLASARSGWQPLTSTHTVPAYLAKVLPYGVSIRCHG
jgi:hypothetical protein